MGRMKELAQEVAQEVAGLMDAKILTSQIDLLNRLEVKFMNVVHGSPNHAEVETFTKLTSIVASIRNKLFANRDRS